MEEPAQQDAGDRERGVGDDVERPAGETEIRRIGLHDRDMTRKAGAQVIGATWVPFDGDHRSAGSDERRRNGAASGADVEDEVARSDPRVSDEPTRPSRIELVPTPLPE